MTALDLNADGGIDFGEFCKFFSSRIATGEVNVRTLSNYWLKTTVNVDIDAVGIPASTLHSIYLFCSQVDVV